MRSDQPAPREPVLNAPWPPLLLCLTLLALYAAQSAWGGFAAIEAHALIPVRVITGEWGGLATHLFLHGGWAHVLLNTAGLLAFGTAVARLLGLGVRGGAAFLAFYLACGVLAGAAFVALNPVGETPVVGASGAVAGLMAGASRLIERPGRLSGWRSPPVIGMGAAWLVINIAAAVLGTLPGAGGASIAWEAHLAGYAAGLLLIAPAWRLSGSRDAVISR
jgi:membrane associated rhomboid family serine protease